MTFLNRRSLNKPAVPEVVARAPRMTLRLLVFGIALSCLRVLAAAEARRVPAIPEPAPALANAPGTNSSYLSNRAPLAPDALITLPIGAVRPKGWVRVCLERQRDGLTGNLGEISAWLQQENNAWLSQDGKGEFGWEEVPYWLRGYLQLAYLLEDPKLIAESRLWMEAVLKSQRPDGDFGPPQRFQNGARNVLHLPRDYHHRDLFGAAYRKAGQLRLSRKT